MAETIETTKSDVEVDISGLTEGIDFSNPDGSGTETTATETTETTETSTTEEASSASDNSVLPPGFTLGDNEKPPEAPVEGEKVEDDLSDEELEKIVEKAPNESYKTNVVRMREIIGKKSQQVEQLRQELEQLKANGGQETPEQLQKMQEELQAAYEKLGRYDLAETPEFKQKYIAPLQTSLNQVAEIVSSVLENPDEAKTIVQTAASMSPIERIQYLDQFMDDAAKTVVAAHFKDIDSLVYQRNQALQDHEASMEQLRQQSTIEEQQRVSQYKESVKNKVLGQLVTDGFNIFQHKAGNEEYNNFVDNLLDNTNQVFESNDPETQARAMLLGTVAPVYKSMYETALSKINELQNELQTVKKAVPGFNGGTDAPISEALAGSLEERIDSLAKEIDFAT